MTLQNLFLENIEVLAVESELTIHRVSSERLFHFTLYMKSGDIVKFSSLSAGIKLVGTSTLNGKRVAVKSLLNKAAWYKQFNTRLCSNDDLSNKLHECYFVEHEGKMKFLEENSSVYKPTASNLAKFEETFFKHLQSYRYDNFSQNSLESWLKATWATLKVDLEGEDKLKARDIIIHVRNSAVEFNKAYPQFRGSIKKGIVLNSFYQVSNLYSAKYKELRIERKATYNYGLFLARLFGYLNFRTKQQYDAVEFKEMIISFINRENPYIQAENDDNLKASIKSLYKAFISNVSGGNGVVYKGQALGVLQSLTSYAAP